MKHPVALQYLRKMAALLGSCLVAAGLGLSPPSQAQTLLATPAPPSQDADSLYIGDGGDDTVKRFDASTGRFLGEFVKHSGDRGDKGDKDDAQLRGPRGLLFDAGGNLLVSNQNVDRSERGEILQYSLVGKRLQGRAIIPSSSKDAPAVPRGIVLWRKDALFAAEFSAEPRANKRVTPGRLLKYTAAGSLIGAFTPPPGSLGTGEFHPRGLVVGPDGLLYVSNFPELATGRGGQVLRFNPDSGAFIDVFIASSGEATCACVNELNRPEGLVFGPDGKLYITSFRASDNDTDKVVVFQGPGGASPGAYVDSIDLDNAGRKEPRAFAQALLFGPEGKLFVPISGDGPATGSVRRYDVSTKTFDVFVKPRAKGGALQLPWYLSFGKTNAATLAYPGAAGPVQGPNLQNCVCQDGSTVQVCAQLDCFSSAEQDAICVPACAPRGGLSGTGCLFDQPICNAPGTAPTVRFNPLR